MRENVDGVAFRFIRCGNCVEVKWSSRAAASGATANAKEVFKLGG